MKKLTDTEIIEKIKYWNEILCNEGIDASFLGVSISRLRKLEAKGLLKCIDTGSAGHSNRRRDAREGLINRTKSRYRFTLNI